MRRLGCGNVVLQGRVWVQRHKIVEDEMHSLTGIEAKADVLALCLCGETSHAASVLWSKIGVKVSTAKLAGIR